MNATINHSATETVTQQNEGSSDSSLSRSPPRSTRKQNGRKIGAKNWSIGEVELLLDLVEEFLPCDSDNWEILGTHFQQDGRSKGNSRDGSACSRKFYKMANALKCTGAAKTLAHISRAKQLKEEICKHELICYGKGKDSNMDSNDGSASGPGNKRIALMAEAIEALRNSNIQASKEFQATITTFEEKMCASYTEESDNTKRIAILEAKVEAMNEKIDSGFHKIIMLLEKNNS